VLLVNTAISNLIREAKTFQIPSMMQVGKAHGMQTLNDALADLVKNKLVTPEEAYVKAVDKAGFESMLKRLSVDTKFLTPTVAPAARQA
jgi:twitching motility protein PilT